MVYSIEKFNTITGPALIAALIFQFVRGRYTQRKHSLLKGHLKIVEYSRLLTTECLYFYFKSKVKY